MRQSGRGTRHGFSLVELLAVVLVLAVLAAVAIPLYINTRKSSAARTCKANIAAIAAAQSAYATRFGTYCYDTGTAPATETPYAAGTLGVAPTGGLIGAPEGLADNLKCPLNGKSYACVSDGQNPAGVVISCQDANQHATDTGASASSWTRTLKAAQNDNSNRP